MEKLNKYLPNELVLIKETCELARIRCIVQGNKFVLEDLKCSRKYSYEINFLDNKKYSHKLYEEDELESKNNLEIYN